MKSYMVIVWGRSGWDLAGEYENLDVALQRCEELGQNAQIIEVAAQPDVVLDDLPF